MAHKFHAKGVPLYYMYNVMWLCSIAYSVWHKTGALQKKKIEFWEFIFYLFFFSNQYLNIITFYLEGLQTANLF